MADVDLLTKFKASPLERPADLDALAADPEAKSPAALLKCVEFLLSKQSLAQPVQHRRRCQALARLSEGCFDQSLFPPLARALKGADGALRTTLGQMLVRVRSQSAFGEVGAHLDSSDPSLRQFAAALLVQLGGKPAFDCFADCLRDAKSPGRLEAIEALVRVGGKHALPVLQLVFVSGTPSERAHGYKCIGQSAAFAKSPGEAVELLRGALDDSNELVAVAAIGSFVKLCTEEEWFDAFALTLESERSALVKAAIEGLARFPSSRALRVLAQKIRSGPNAVRFTVIAVLEAIGNDDVLPILVEGLSSRHLVVRTRAGEVMQRLSVAGKLDLARTIVWLLKSRDVNVRRMAVEIAKTVKDPNAQLWPKLLHLLRDEDWWVRERVVDVLVELAGKELTRHIAAYLQDPSDVVRRYAVNVLARLKDHQSLGLLVRTAQSDADWWVREKAIEAIALLKDPRAIPYLEQLLQTAHELRWALISALKELGSIGSAALVAECLADEDPEIRLLALECLERLGDARAATAVTARLRDEHPKVRERARGLLKLWSVAGPAETISGGDALTPLDRWLVQMVQGEGDDLLLVPGRLPSMKRLGKIVPIAQEVAAPAFLREQLGRRLNTAQIEDLGKLRDVDFSYSIPSLGLRFRANVFAEQQGLGAVFRIIKGRIPDITSLGLPAPMLKLGDIRNGLVLIGGPTGSGKSTTLAAVINAINEKESRHIISLEDPIEAIHESKRSLVNQREIGTHTDSYADALRGALRQDPDVILVGELRDLPTISFAVTAAETGHLVFGTVHTVSADTTVDRVVNAFPAAQQDQIRNMLSQSLRAVCCQFLVKGVDGESRHLATEVMLNNDAISALIRKGKAFQIPSVISTAREEGMQLMDMDLLRLLKEHRISPEEAFVKARNKKDFEPYLQGAAPGPSGPAAPSGAQPRPSAPPPRSSAPPVAATQPRASAPQAPSPTQRVR